LLGEYKKEGKVNTLQPPDFKNFHHWFNKNVISDLTVLRECIRQATSHDEKVNDFFLVCFSNTIRKSSNIRADDNPYFIRAMVGEELIDYHPDVEATFHKQAESAISRMEEFHHLVPKNVSTRILLEDCRRASIAEGLVDLVVTSPPYGEESHTMAYSRFSKLSLLWMRKNIVEINRAASKSMGGTKIVFRKTSPLLDSLYEKVTTKNKERAGEMFSFIWDYRWVMVRLAKLLKVGGQCCIVIGDRTVSGIAIPNGELTVEIAREAGLSYVTQYERDIPKKVLPRKDYKVELINKEHIIILEKAREVA
jgi:site-specific DNA-methyltransferase (cytosine-N4-specific)